MAVALLGAGITVHAQTSAKDSMRVVNLQEVQVVSTRATAKTPVAFTNIGKAELKKVNFGQDIPYLLSMTPSTLTTSDAELVSAIRHFAYVEPMAHESTSR